MLMQTQPRSNTNIFSDNSKITWLITQITKYTLRPPQDDYPSIPVILLETMQKRPVTFCGFDKRYKDPAPSPRYPTQRLPPYKPLWT